MERQCYTVFTWIFEILTNQFDQLRLHKKIIAVCSEQRTQRVKCTVWAERRIVLCATNSSRYPSKGWIIFRYFKKVYILLAKIKFCLHGFFVYRLWVEAGRLLVLRNDHPPIWDTLPFWYVTPRQGDLLPYVSTRYTGSIFRGRNTREEWRRLKGGKVRAAQCSRTVGNQPSRDDASRPRRQMNRCGSRKFSFCCRSGRNVLLWLYVSGGRRGQPEEELILFRYVLFTVWTVRQSEADMKYFNMKWRGKLVNLFRFFSKLNATKPLHTLSYTLQVFLEGGWVRKCKPIKPGSQPTAVLTARRAIWTQAAEYTNGDGRHRCLTCWAFSYGMWRYLAGPVRPGVSQNVQSLSSSVERSSRTPVASKGKGKGTVFFWKFRRR